MPDMMMNSSRNQIKLRPYQVDAVNAIWNGLAEVDGNILAVLPTGVGKAICLCEFIRKACTEFPDVRILAITFSKELVEQNYKEMIGLWPQVNAGIHSAGLNSRDVNSSVIFGSIQSIHKKAFALQRVNVIIVDEAQAIPRNANTMWLKFFADVKSINPDVRIIGLTATPWRMDVGLLHKGKDAIFSEIVYEYSILDAIREGYLAHPVSRPSRTQIDTSKVAIRGGEFVASELDAAASDPETINAIADEMVANGQNRRSWILFGSGIKTCMLLRDAIRERGYSCEGVFATTPNKERDAIILAFKRQEIRCLVSVVALMTGFNAPSTDLVGLARPTHSAGLYIQSCGRGTRPVYAPGYDLSTAEGRLAAIAAGPKPDVLILDWGSNIKRHGPLDQPLIKEKREGAPGDAPIKVCPNCESECAISARECVNCGYEFEIVGSKLNTKAAAGPLLSSQIVPEYCDVSDVSYRPHTKPDKPPSLKVQYQCGLAFYPQWVSFEYAPGSYPRRKAEQWWLERGQAPVPSTVKEALMRIKELKKPKRILVKPAGKFFDVLQAEF